MIEDNGRTHTYTNTHTHFVSAKIIRSIIFTYGNAMLSLRTTLVCVRIAPPERNVGNISNGYCSTDIYHLEL
jgi:hypothetical protein